MQWIAIHENVLGGKLRGLRKNIGCSEAEALGILTYLWLWARKNADKDGLLLNTDKDDIAESLQPCISKSLDAETVTDALINEGWIDFNDGNYFIHDWYEWQQYWYTYLEKREKDRLRKRAERERKREYTPPLPNTETKKRKTRKKKEPAEEKNEYAKKVHMTSAEYNKLIEKYGQAFTDKAVEKLNFYKESNGKEYKSDYAAINNWVIETVKKDHPELIRKEEKKSESGNPYEEFK